MLLSLHSGCFTCGGDTGQLGYNLCTVTVLTCLLGQSGGLRLQLAPRPQGWRLLFGEQRRAGEHRVGVTDVPAEAWTVLPKLARLGKRAQPHSHLDIHTPTREKATHVSCVLAPSGQGSAIWCYPRPADESWVPLPSLGLLLPLQLNKMTVRVSSVPATNLTDQQ